jgi:membrane protein YqaA with SNARE-associated domain
VTVAIPVRVTLAYWGLTVVVVEEPTLTVLGSGVMVFPLLLPPLLQALMEKQIAKVSK